VTLLGNGEYLHPPLEKRLILGALKAPKLLPEVTTIALTTALFFYIGKIEI
jgi:hypothetical protein